MLATTKDTVFSRIYFDALLAGERESVAKIYAREIVAGKSRKYINAYISGLDFKKMSEKYSRAYAQQIADGKGIDYAELYAQAINEGHSNAQAEGIAKKEIADRAQRLRAQREAEAAQEARRKAQKAQDDRAYWTFYNDAYRTEMQKRMDHDYATFYATFYAQNRIDGMNQYAASTKAHEDIRNLIALFQKCGNIEIAKHFGSTIFEKKISGASVTKVVQDNPPLSARDRRRAEELGDVYWFKVHYTRFGRAEIGRVVVDKTTCAADVLD